MKLTVFVALGEPPASRLGDTEAALRAREEVLRERVLAASAQRPLRC